MELKYMTLTKIEEKEFYRSNCTFMELKYLCYNSILCSLCRSNCTFMELKFINAHVRIVVALCVLIVPLWN